MNEAKIINALLELTRLLQSTIEGAVNRDIKDWSTNLRDLEKLKKKLENIQ